MSAPLPQDYYPSIRKKSHSLHYADGRSNGGPIEAELIRMWQRHEVREPDPSQMLWRNFAAHLFHARPDVSRVALMLTWAPMPLYLRYSTNEASWIDATEACVIVEPEL